VFLQDARYAVRALWSSKPFAAVGILCLGFGIGLNTTIFSIIDGVLLKPYPYSDPDRILVLGEQNQRAGDESGLSYLDMRDWKEATSTFTTIAASRTSAMTVSDSGGEPERYLGAAVSWDLFPLLGTPPILGRASIPTTTDRTQRASSCSAITSGSRGIRPTRTSWAVAYSSTRSPLLLSA
jgi:putative ABC transport system permease protein